MDKFKMLLTRVYDLVFKMISVKGFVFLIATIAMFCGLVDMTFWSFFAAGFVGMRFLEKLIGSGPAGYKK